MRERTRKHDDAHYPLQGRGKRATMPKVKEEPTMTLRIRQALDLARIVIADQIEHIEANSCTLDGTTGNPRLDTMDPLARPEHRQCLRAVKLIDMALEEIEK